MGRHSKTVIEYRSYEFPPHFPLRVIAGEEWRISDVPSGVLHFHATFHKHYKVRHGQ